MSNKNTQKEYPFILPLFITLLLLVIVFHHYFPIVSTKAPVFNDFIIETIAKTGLNKAGELNLFKILTILGLFLMTSLSLLLKNCPKVFARAHKKKQKPCYNSNAFYGVMLICIIPFLLCYIVFKKPLYILLLLSIFAILCYIISINMNRDFLSLFSLILLSYYSIMGLLTTLVVFSSAPEFTAHFHPTTKSIYIVSISLAFILLICTSLLQNGKTLQRRAILLLQFFIPLLLTLYFVDTYMLTSTGDIVTRKYAAFYYAFFAFLIVTFLLDNLKNTIKSWNNPLEKTDFLITKATAITVFVYNSFSAAPLYAQPDQHHHGEQMIPFQQIILLRQTPYKEYTPVSGLFPMVNGFIQNVLMRGTVSDYSPAISVTMVLFCIVTMFLLCKRIGNFKALIFSTFFCLVSYNRQYMLLPGLLLLFDDSFTRTPEKESASKQLLWIYAWIWVCFLAGLYYPLYGAALLLGTIPAGLYKTCLFIKNGSLKSCLKKPLFYVSLCIVFIPVFTAIPMLLRMVRHTLSYSGQTILADGIALYNQSPPDYFLPFGFFVNAHASLRSQLYILYRFFLPLTALLVYGFLFIKQCMLWVTRKKNSAYSFNPGLFFGYLCGFITLAVSYSYTLVRADVNMILSRTAPVLINMCGIFLPYLLIKYGAINKDSICQEDAATHVQTIHDDDNADRTSYTFKRLLLIAVCFSLPVIIYHNVSSLKFPDMWIYPNGEASLIMDDSSKLYNYYEVPSIMISMDEVPLKDKSMLGNGFMVSDQTEYLLQYEKVMNKCRKVNKEQSYLGFDGQGFYYYLNAKACYTGFIQAGKGFIAQQSILDAFKKERPVVFLIEPQSNYYVYYEMMTSGYVYSHEDQAYYPQELYVKLTDSSSETDSLIQQPQMLLGDDVRYDLTATDFGLIAASFGNSFDFLSGLLCDEKSILNMPDENIIITGYKQDALYLRMDIAKLKSAYPDATKIRLSFKSDQKEYDSASILCDIGNDNLLLPLGMNPTWLYGENSDIRVTLLTDDDLQTDSLPNSNSQSLASFASDYCSVASFYKITQTR